MSIVTLGLILFAVCIGCLPPIQAGINATLAGHYGHPLWAAVTNTLVASGVLALAIGALRSAMPEVGPVSAAPAWSWLGGALGAAMVLSAIIVAPRLGAASYVTAMTVGTVTASMVIDHFGWIGFPEHPISLWRLGGGALVVVGMVVVQIE